MKSVIMLCKNILYIPFANQQEKNHGLTIGHIMAYLNKRKPISLLKSVNMLLPSKNIYLMFYITRCKIREIIKTDIIVNTYQSKYTNRTVHTVSIGISF